MLNKVKPNPAFEDEELDADLAETPWRTVEDPPEARAFGGGSTVLLRGDWNVRRVGG
jgi:hypothetical protein